MRPVAIAGVGLLCPAGIGQDGAIGGRPGEVPGFRPMAYIEDRKRLKLMSRGVQLGLAALRLALTATDGWDDVPPPRRGFFVGASPQIGDPDDLRPALEAARGPDGSFSLERFASQGLPLIHPLWLVRGLSNNVLGFGSAFWDIQGVNMSYCDGAEGGWTALSEGFHAVAEGRADLVVAGGADSLLGADALFGGRRCGEGAAVLVLRVASGRPNERLVPSMSALRQGLDLDEELLGYLGAAAWPVALARQLLAPPLFAAP
jgi:Beta-ketoacyl synthase, N-terminal domain